MKLPLNRTSLIVALALCGTVAQLPDANANLKSEITSPKPFSREAIMTMVAEEAYLNTVVPPELAIAVARVESNFNVTARSHAGAIGVMQIMPATGKGEFGVEAASLYDARVNIRIGVAYLEQLYRMYGNDWDAALSHYNGGTLRTAADGTPIPHGYTEDYVSLVNRHWDSYKQDVQVAEIVAGIKAEGVPFELAGGPDDQILLGGPQMPTATAPASQPSSPADTAGIQSKTAPDLPEQDLPASTVETPVERIVIQERPAASAAAPVSEAPQTRAQPAIASPRQRGSIYSMSSGSRAVTGGTQPATISDDIFEARRSFRAALERHESELLN